MTEELKWEWSAMTNCTKKEALDYIGERNNLNAELKEAREALNQIEELCDGHNRSHEQIWLITYRVLNKIRRNKYDT